jgi:DNA-binding NtrC family response regulator
LFLDDIDDLPAAVQVKILRVIQEREIEPVGADRSIPVDFRLICATKADLYRRAEEGRFRADLYFRLNVIPLKLPTLAERREDIPTLVQFLVEQKGGRDNFRLSAAHFDALMNHSWPGNVRELENVVERMLALPDIPVSELFDTLLTTRNRDTEPAGEDAAPVPPLPPSDGPVRSVDYRDYMTTCERRLLEWALAVSGQNISMAARLLGLPRSTLRSKLDKA